MLRITKVIFTYKNKISQVLVLILVMPFTSQLIFPQSHSIMSYNIRYDNEWDKVNSWEIRKDEVIKLIYEYDPGIIGIQEGLLNQVLYINNALNNYEYFGVGRDDGKDKGEFCSIFYDKARYDLQKSSTFWLSETPGEISVGWDAALERICTYGLFLDKKKGEDFWVFNTHFDHIGSIAREKSAELILKKIASFNHRNLPVIIMGDFNSIPGSPPIEKIKTKLSDSFEVSIEKPKGPVGTYNAFNPSMPIDKRIDYIFTKDFKVLSFHHIDDRLHDNNHISDHLPVLIHVQ